MIEVQSIEKHSIEITQILWGPETRGCIMQNNDSNGSRASWARGAAALGIVLVMGLGLMASPAEADPFVYVPNDGAATVSVIDAATNMVVGAPIPVGTNPFAVAVTPDGKHAYVANDSANNISVIDTATNTVVGSPIPVGSQPLFVAVTPDGKQAYVTNLSSNSVSVIDTATNTVVGTPIPVGVRPVVVAITPDGKHAYVTNESDNTVSVIDTATKAVVGTPIPLGGTSPSGIVITPDGKHAYVTIYFSNTVLVIDTATNTVVGSPIPVGTNPRSVAITPNGTQAYVTNQNSNTVSVIDTTTNTVVGTPIPLGTNPWGVVVTPDGKYAYVTNASSGNVSVIDTATNTVVGAPIPVGSGPFWLGIIPPPQGVPFLAFSAKLQIALDRKANHDAFALESSFTLSSTASNGINPLTEAVKLQVGTFTTTIPPGSFKKSGRLFTFVGSIGGVNLQALIAPTGTLRYAFLAAAERASLTGTTNPVPVMLTIGDDSGMISVKAAIIQLQPRASASP